MIQETDLLDKRKNPPRTAYGLDCYFRVFYTNELIKNYAQTRNVEIKLKEAHPRDSEGQQYEPTHRHEIFLMNKVAKIHD